MPTFRRLARSSASATSTSYAGGLAGVGLIQAKLSALAPRLASRALVEILPHLRPQPLPVSFVVAHRRNLSRRVRTFMHWLETVLVPYLERSVED
jgi:DNA-binding transcriptional LysR family regulator